MKTRTTMMLLLVVLIIGGIVVLDHYKGTTTEEARTKRKRILEFQARDITRIELVRPEQTILLEKSDDRWEIRQPLTVRASFSAVSSILDELEFAERERLLAEKEIAHATLADFGLDAPRLRLTLHGKAQPMTVLIGGETPTREAIYAQVQGSKDVLVARKSTYDRLNRTLDDLRDRALMDFSTAAATRLEIRSDERVIEISRPAIALAGEARWTLTRPLAARADQRTVTDLLSELNAIRVLDFVSEDPKQVHAYGLDEPRREITVWSGDVARTLLLGSSPADDAGKVHAKLKNADSIVTVPASSVEKFAVQVNDLRDRRVLSFAEDQLQAVEVIRGADKIALSRDNGPGTPWKITAPRSAPAEEGAARQLLTRLRDLSVQQFTADLATDLDKYGLAVPAATVTLLGEGTNVVAQLLIGALDPERNVREVKRADEPFVYGVDPAITEWLPPNYLTMRSRRLADVLPQQITRLTIRNGDATTVVERNAEGRWQLVEPAQGVLDVDSLQRLVEMLTQMQAREFVQDDLENLGVYGLDTPQLTVTAVAGDKSYVLAVGTPHDADHLYASWNDPPLVFTLSTFYTNALSRPVVAAAPTKETGAVAVPRVEVVTPPVAAPPPDAPESKAPEPPTD